MKLSIGSMIVSKICRSLRNDEDMEWGSVPVGTIGQVVAIEDSYGQKWATVRWSLDASPLDDQIVEEEWNTYLK